MKSKLIDLKIALKKEMENILQFWQNSSLDIEHGGFYGRIDYKNRVIPNSTKGIILNTRILWTFSAAFNFFKREEYLEIANRAFNYLNQYFLDNDNGGFYWEVDYKGNPINTRKQIYAQAFSIYSFSEYYKASGNIKSLQKAQEIFWLIEKYSFDALNIGYIEALDKKWQPLQDMRLSDKDANEPKTMNTHLHILESYTALYHIWKDKTLARQLKSLIQIFLNKIIDSESNHLNLFFDLDWTVKSSIVSFGHDIEGSWLLTEAAETLKDKELLKEVERIAINLVDSTMKEGIDDDFSLFYEYEKDSNKMDFDKHWWPQGEAMVGLVNAWKITGDQGYLEKVLKVWDFIRIYFINNKYGGWNSRINASNQIVYDDDIINLWKGPYHNTRACMEVFNRLF